MAAMALDPRRPLRRCRDLAARYPDGWAAVDHLRAGRGVDLPAWPTWCFLPLAGAIAITSGGQSPTLDQVVDAAVLAACAAWRVTQGIYAFDPALLGTLWAQPLEEAVPVDVLLQLPEWCVYISTPDTRYFGQRLYGFFAHLEWDTQTQRRELRLVWDTDHGLEALPILLDLPPGVRPSAAWPPGSLAAMFQHLLDEQHLPATSAVVAEWIRQVAGAVHCVLYLCAQNRDITDRHGRPYTPHQPAPLVSRRGPFTPPAPDPRTWQVGWRVGAALAHATEPSGGDAGGAHARPRPHIRRAHWHTFWTGPRDGTQTPVVHWLPPTMIAGADPASIVPVIHPQRGGEPPGTQTR